MHIGITDTYNTKFDFYARWLRKVAKESEVVKLSYKEQNGKALASCDGLILTGGCDVHPKFYGKESSMHLIHDVDEKRDEFELRLVREALKMEIPLLGICRGMQLFNVSQGGSLIPDVKSEGYGEHAKTAAGKDQRHNIEIDQGTTLHWIVESSKCEVNTAHHQAVDAIGKGLRRTARSPDGIVEGLEWVDGERRPFLQLVQWHPERMEDYANPCSKNILEHFVLAVVSRADE